MADSIRMEGHEEIIQSFRNADKLIQSEGTRYLDELGNWGTGRAKAYTLDAGAVDLGELVQGIHYNTKVVSDGVETIIKPSDKADDYAIYVEEGTKPHFPPIKAIQGWADRHGIPAYAVALKISREGTEPRHIFRDTFNDLWDKAQRSAPSFAEKLIRKI